MLLCRKRLSLLLIRLFIAAIGGAASVLHAGAIPDGPNSRITDGGLVQYSDAEWPSLAVLGETVYATWLDDRYGNDNSVMFARSDDNGRTWSQNTLVSLVPYDDWTEHPQIAVQPDGTIWIVWYLFYAQDSNNVNDLRLARSTDGGASWSLYLLKDGGEKDDLWKTRVAADDQYLYVLYHDYASNNTDKGYNILLNRVDTAQLKHQDIMVNDVAMSGRISGGIQDDGPQLDLSLRETEQGALLCAVWEDRRSRASIYGACSDDQGSSFSANFNISGSDAVMPNITIAPDGRLYATYSSDTDGRKNILLRASDDKGQSWGEPKPVTHLESDEVSHRDLEVDNSGQVLVAWVHDRYGENDINLSTSSDSGNHFAVLVDMEDAQGEHPDVSSPNQVRLATGPTEGDDSFVYLAWRDTRNPENEIWFTRAILDGTPPTTPSGVVAEGVDRAIRLSWQASSDANGVKGYRVFRAESESDPFEAISPVLVQALAYTDVGLEPGDRYVYRIAAVDGTGNMGAQSQTAEATAKGGESQPGGVLFYEQGDAIRSNPLNGGAGQTITDSSSPVLSPGGDRLYYRSSAEVAFRPINKDGSLGDVTHFMSREGMSEFDIAADNQHFAVIETRSQYNEDLGFCFVSEPIFATKDQKLFTDQHNLSSYVTISADHHWMGYRYDGFCHGLAYGNTYPGDFCLANLATQERYCLEGADVKGADFPPSGHSLVFASPLSGQHEVWKAEVSNEGTLINYQQLTRGPDNQPVDNPRWSSDGEWIVFQRDLNPDTDEEAVNWQLFAVRADGTALRELNLAGERPVLVTEGGASNGEGSGSQKPGTSSSGGGALPLWLLLLVSSVLLYLKPSPFVPAELRWH